MGAILINSTTAEYLGSSAETSKAVSVTNSASAGNTLIVICGWNSSADTLTSVTDSKGNTYTIDIQDTHSTGGEGLAIVSGYLTTSLTRSDTITMTITNIGSTTLILRASEWSGIVSSSRLDKVSNNEQVNTDPATSGTTAALAQGDELVVGANIQNNNTTSIGSGYTSLFQNLANTGSFIRYLSGEFKLNGELNGVSATFGNNGFANTTTLVASYKTNISSPYINTTCRM